MAERHAVLDTVWRDQLSEAENAQAESQLSRKGRRLWATLRHDLKGRIRFGKIDPANQSDDAQALYDLVFAKARNMSKGKVYDFWQMSDGLLDEIRERFTAARLERLGVDSMISALESNHTELGKRLNITVGVPESDSEPSMQNALLRLRKVTRRYVLRLQLVVESDPSQADRVKHLLVPLQRWRDLSRQDRRDRAAKKAEAKKAKTKKAEAPAPRMTADNG
jgi:hypothetical protein